MQLNIRIKNKRILRKAASRPGRINVALDPKFFEYLKDRHLRFLNRGYGRERPWCALLGKNEDGVVKKLVKLYPTSSDGVGCWNMPAISPGTFTDTAIKLAKRGLMIAGLVRIGKFHLKESESIRGISMKEFARQAPKFFVMSFGLEGLSIESYSLKVKKLIEHGWYVKEGGMNHGKTNVSRRDFRSRKVQKAGEGDVRETDRASSRSRAQQGDDTSRVSEQETTEFHVSNSGEQEFGRSRLRPSRGGHSDNDIESQRGNVSQEETAAEEDWSRFKDLFIE